MTNEERHFLSHLVEALLIANSAEEYQRLATAKVLDGEVSEELNISLLTLSELSSSLTMNDSIMKKIRHVFKKTQDPHITYALELAEVNL